MASDTPVFVRILRFWITALKVLGGFPYSWSKEASRTMFPGLRLKRSLQIWSNFMVILNSTTVVIMILNMIINWSNRAFTSSTQEAWVKILFIFESVASVILHFHLWHKKSDLLSLVDQMDKCATGLTLRDWTIPRNIELAAIFILHVLHYGIGTKNLIQWTHEKTDTISFVFALSRILFYQLNGLVTYIIAMLFYMIGCFVDMALSNIYETLKITEANVIPWDETNIREKPEGAAVKEVDRWIDSHFVSVGKRAGQEVGKVNCDVMKRRREATVPEVREACRRLCDIQDCQEFMSRYFSIPCLNRTALYAFFIITDLYNAVGKTNVETLIKYSIYFLHDISVVALFCCGGEMTKTRVKKLQLTVARHVAETSHPELEKQLKRLRDVLEIYPDFSVGGFYIASKNTLVAIASFVATYLVILMQFKATEV